MAKGYSLHVALNIVDPDSYGGWDGKLNACVYDGEDMALLFGAEGFHTTGVPNQWATRDTVLGKLAHLATVSQPGDLVVVTYSGHGGQVPDINGDEDDCLDETWCLYDGQLIDDELYAAWSQFQAGVRIVVLSDSCHSGTIARFAALPERSDGGLRRAMPNEVIPKAYAAQKSLYDDLQFFKPKTAKDVKASVLQISGCQDSQTSMDGPFNGAFTAALLKTWNQATFKGSYRAFKNKIATKLPSTQQPNLITFGGKSFVTEQPFKV